MSARERRAWPEGRKFAFTIIDDTDHATTDRVRPIYNLLTELGLRTTKTVWVRPAPDDERWGDGETLEDEGYRRFVLELKDRGFEIALHCARGTSTRRPEVRAALDRFTEILGEPPRVHANHAQNRDNLYWGSARMPAWRRRLRLYRTLAEPSYGHDERSEYFWGDLCRERIRYVRAHPFPVLDTGACDPYMPYFDPRYPYVNAWFSCSLGANPRELKRLIALEAQQRLESQEGLAIVYTHFGVPGFLDSQGGVDPDLQGLLVALSRRNGWFRPVGEILDHIRTEPVHCLRPWQAWELALRSRAAH